MIPLVTLGMQFFIGLTLHTCICIALLCEAYSEYHDSQKLAEKWERTIFAMAREQEVNNSLSFFSYKQLMTRRMQFNLLIIFF